MYGNGTMNVIGERDPEKLIRRQAEAQVDREGVPSNALLAMVENLDTAAYRARLAEVEAEIRRHHLDELHFREHPTATRQDKEVPNCDARGRLPQRQRADGDQCCAVAGEASDVVVMYTCLA
jgi:hypothetical protein